MQVQGQGQWSFSALVIIFIISYLFPMRISLQRLPVKVLKMGQFAYQSAGPGLCLQSQPVTSGLQLTKLFQTTLD